MLNTHNLLSKKQSGIRPGTSTLYQLISITSNIYGSIENYEETSVVFLDISKAFDKVWHGGNPLDFFENDLQNRYQRVVLNGTEYNWGKIDAGVSQGSVI